MPHIVINHHFFYPEPDPTSKAFKGPSKDTLNKQLLSLKEFATPAKKVLEGAKSDDFFFSITIDDGSKSILDIADVLLDHKVHTEICICGETVTKNKILQPHKINLLRNKLGDKLLFSSLKEFYHFIDFSSLKIHDGFNEVDLYRYDSFYTRKIKIALNYQLDKSMTKKFIDHMFASTFSDEGNIAESLYLSLSNIYSLRNEFSFAYHGTKHLLWSNLKNSDLIAEITPPSKLSNLFKDEYFLSIPFGMEGSYSKKDLLALSPSMVKGAYTMGRSINHTVDTKENFLWIHRYDQVDLFNPNGSLKKDTILS